MPVYVIQNMGLADGRFTPERGKYLSSYDPDAFNGRGHAVWSTMANAWTFANMEDAWAVWRQTSVIRPLRADGHPNRPLMAYTVAVTPYQLPQQEVEMRCTMRIENGLTGETKQCDLKASHWLSIDQSGQLARCPDHADSTLFYLFAQLEWDDLHVAKSPRQEP